MPVSVRIPAQLRDLVAGAHAIDVEVDGDAGTTTVGSVLDAMADAYPALERRVRDELGQARTHVNLFVGADNMRDLDGLATPIPPGTELSIIPAISGGSV
jgi:molybdopterin converting factor small subunit